MNLTIYTARCTGNKANCVYPDRRKVRTAEELAAAAGQPVERLFTALMAFGETGLLSWRLNPFSVVLTEHPARCRMTDSPLIRYLRAGTGAGAAGGES